MTFANKIKATYFTHFRKLCDTRKNVYNIITNFQAFIFLQQIEIMNGYVEVYFIKCFNKYMNLLLSFIIIVLIA